MTIQQHASFDSSAAELNATSKLVKAWESKNAKNAAKAGGISMMALSLAACGGSSTTTTTATTGTTTTTTTDAAKALALTASSVTGTYDGANVAGGSGADTYSGIVTYTDAASPVIAGSFEAGDAIDGGAGTDTVSLTVTGGGAAAYTTGALPAAMLTGVENLSVRSILTEAADILTIDMTNYASVTGLTSNLSTNVVTATNLVATDTVNIVGNGSITNGNTNLGYTATTTSGEFTVDGDTTGGTVAVTGAALTTLTINSTGGTNVLTGVTSAATTEDVVINATTNLDLGTGISAIAAATGNSVTVSGAATSVDLGSNAVDADIDTIDASGLTAGGIIATQNSATAVITGGAGNDTITANSIVLTTGSVDAGAGDADQLIITAGTEVATAALGAKYTNFEVLTTTGESQDVSLVSGITSVKMGADTSGSITGLNATQAANITVTGDQTTAATFALTTATGTADVLTLKLGSGLTNTASTDLNTSLVVTGFETLNLQTNQGPTATAANSVSTVGAITGATLANINLTGGGFSIANAATTLATTIDGSELTGVLTLGGNLIAGSTVKGGAGADLFTAGTNNGVSYTGNAGNDQLTATVAQLVATGTNDTTFVGGDGTDKLVASDAAATLTDNHFTNMSGLEALSTSGTGNTSITVGAAYNAAFSGGTTVTTGTLADQSTYTFSGGLSTTDQTITITGTSLGGGAGEDIIVTTGSGADTVTFTGDATWIGAAGDGGAIEIATGAGADTISVTIGTLLAQTTSQAIVIDAGTGADTITMVKVNSAGAEAHAVITVDAGDSTSTGYDKITGFDVSDGTAVSDVLDFTGTAVAGTVATQNDFGTILSSSVTAGVATFDDAAGFSAAIIVNATNLADVVGYLALNTATNDTVAFAFDSTGNGANDATMVYHNGTTDSLVQLTGVTGVDAVDVAGAALSANDLFIA